jgi:hypothetical protein
MKKLTLAIALTFAIAAGTVTVVTESAHAINFEGDAKYTIDGRGHVRLCWTTGTKECISFTSTGESRMCDDVKGTLSGVIDYLNKAGRSGSIKASFESCIRGPGYMGMLCVGRITSYNYCGYVKGPEPR